MAVYQLTPNGVVRTLDAAHIPADPSNRDWVAYQDWLAAGNTPDPIPGTPPRLIISALDFFDRFTDAERAAIWASAASNPAIGVGLINGLSAGTIDLSSAAVSTWLDLLISAGALLVARKSSLLAPA